MKKKFSVSFPYFLEYPVKIAVNRLGLLGFFGWIFQKFGKRLIKPEHIIVSERIVEIPNVYLLLGSYLRPETTILEIGHVNSTLALELASLGYRVTGIDLRPYPFAHPNLTNVRDDFLRYDWRGQKFAAIVMVSTLEHLDFNRRYGGKEDADRGLDRLACARVSQLLEPGGNFILTVPYARAMRSDTWFKTYTRENLRKLLGEVFQIAEEKYFTREGRTWRPAADPAADPDYPYDGVAIFRLTPK